MQKDSLGDRMKINYENIERRYLMRRMPTIIRVDGKAFHTFTKGFERPFDDVFINSMWEAAVYLCENVQGCKMAYMQSDEISLLLTDYDSLDTQAWFDKNIVKMISVSASMATMAFNNAFITRAGQHIFHHRNIPDDERAVFNNRIKVAGTAMFDSRVFNIPKEEVCNYFIWRQQDATRNAIQMLGQAHFTHKQLHEKDQNEIQEMLWQEKQINFNDLPAYLKRGASVIKETYEKDGAERTRWVVDKDMLILTQDRRYVERFVYPISDDEEA